MYSEFTSLLRSVATKWNETATTLQAQTPEVTRTAQELQTSFNSGLQTFFDEAKKVGREVLRCEIVTTLKFSAVNANSHRRKYQENST